MNNKSKILVFCVVLLVGFLSVCGNANALLIDNFGTTNMFIEANSSQAPVDNAGATATTGLNEALGDHRFMELLTVSGSASPNRKASLETFDGSLFYSNDTQISSTARLTWSGGPDGTGTLGGIDLTDGGSMDSIEILLESMDIPDALSMTVSVTDTGADVATKTIAGASITAGDVSAFIFNTFDNFALVNFTTVDRITLDLTAAVGSDLALRFISTTSSSEVVATPEASTIILLGIGIAGLGGGCLRRRLKKKRSLSKTLTFNLQD